MFEFELQKILKTVSGLEDYPNKDNPQILMPKVFILNAPEKTKSPYVVYTMNRSSEEYILEGVTGNKDLTFDINLYSKDTLELKTIQNEILHKLLNLLGTTQGGFLIQNVKVEMRDFYDSNVDLYRAVLELEIYI